MIGSRSGGDQGDYDDAVSIPASSDFVREKERKREREKERERERIFRISTLYGRFLQAHLRQKNSNFATPATPPKATISPTGVSNQHWCKKRTAV
jgi:hypothetical protein